MSRLRGWVRSASTVLIVFTGGCAEELGPEPRETTRVTGRVTEGGKPVGKGWIEFLPYVGTVGNMRSAPLRPDGSFAIDGVAVGLNRVGIAGAPIGLFRGRRFFDPLGSPILRTVKKSSTEPIRIELYDEVMRTISPQPPAGQGK